MKKALIALGLLVALALVPLAPAAAMPVLPCDIGCEGCPVTSKCTCPGVPEVIVTCGSEWAVNCPSFSPFLQGPVAEDLWVWASEEESEEMTPEAEPSAEANEAVAD